VDGLLEGGLCVSVGRVFGGVEGARGGWALRRPGEGANTEHHRRIRREGGPQLARLQHIWCEAWRALVPATREFEIRSRRAGQSCERVVGFGFGSGYGYGYGYDNG
jgi:hypothetical protein